MGQYSLNNDEGFAPLRKHGEPQLYGLTHMVLIAVFQRNCRCTIDFPQVPWEIEVDTVASLSWSLPSAMTNADLGNFHVKNWQILQSTLPNPAKHRISAVSCIILKNFWRILQNPWHFHKIWKLGWQFCNLAKIPCYFLTLDSANSVLKPPKV